MCHVQCVTVSLVFVVCRRSSFRCSDHHRRDDSFRELGSSRTGTLNCVLFECASYEHGSTDGVRTYQLPMTTN
jgi:hypothetical protein